MGTFRALIAIFSALIAFLATVSGLAAQFGDHNERWATRFLWVALAAGLIFLAAFLL